MVKVETSLWFISSTQKDEETKQSTAFSNSYLYSSEIKGLSFPCFSCVLRPLAPLAEGIFFGLRGLKDTSLDRTVEAL